MTTKKLNIKLQGVPETLLLPLYGRAQFSGKRNQFFVDKEAIRLANAIDFNFSKIKDNLHPIDPLYWSARAYQFDQALEIFLKKHPTATVVNLGAGLDTSFSRNDNGKLKWFDLDVAEVIYLRKQLLSTNERVTHIGKSIFDFSWMEQIPKKRKVFFIAGGLFMYFTKEQVTHIFKQLGKTFQQSEIIFDVISEHAITAENKMIANTGICNATMQWGIKNADIITKWHPEFNVIKQQPFFKSIRHYYISKPILYLQMLWWDTIKYANIFHLGINL